MIAFFKKTFKWSSPKKEDNKKIQTSHYIIAVFTGILEEILFWKKLWLSLSCILFLNVIFFVFRHKEFNLLSLSIYLYISYLLIDGFEAWLKYKHRTTCLKRLADQDGSQLKAMAAQLKTWFYKKWLEFMYLRDTNPTKAFLLINIILGIIFLTGQYLRGYVIMYLLSMTLTLFYKMLPPIVTVIKKIQQNAESDVEFEGLMPEVSEVDINLLTIEPESNQIYDERQSLDYWKPDDVPLEEASDSSENSSSLVTNLSIEKMKTLDKNVETSDSSEDEYMPRDQQQKEQLLSTLEEIRSTPAWSASAYNALWNITGVVTNLMYTKTDETTKRKRVSSVDSSDGFEMVDKQDLM
ncbi:uncharacterized protein LOC135071860 isoform X1 [Ostrinia nubilalis]|uniref:uncharacterized protein LOC114365675 n=2 Tax=Ostrinia TaxID=29056 RepID=UPI0010401B5A|nr:uncharacterized protein LOC114365675 [Ostrinia furnacalis]